MKRFVLIDGSSYLYRAYHALPPLTAPDGSPTGALFGVVNMLRSTLKEKPDFAAFVVDAPGPTFRDEMFPEYKAQRPPMPSDLRAQVEPMLAIVEALGIPILREPGVEADDVIGTLAIAAVREGIETTISTSDKDFAQLVQPGIALINTMSGSRMVSNDDVIARFGVPPARIVDYLALMGDAVDNIPGVAKCGPKTAAKWLGQYGTLDGVIERAGEVGGKIGENLRAALHRLPMNRELVTIRTDVPLPEGPSDLALRERDAEALRGLYARYGFNQALRELDGGNGSSVGKAIVEKEPAKARGSAYVTATAPNPDIDPTLSAPGEYETLLTPEAFAAWIEKLHAAPLIAFDTETDSLDPMRARLVGLSFSVEPGRAAYVPLAHDYPGAPVQLAQDHVLDALRPILEDPGKPKLGQHGKYDLHVMRRHGVVVRGYAHDTLLESFVLNSTATRHDLDSLAQRYLGYQTIRYEDIAGKGAKQIPFSQVDIDSATRYAAEDADICLRLHSTLSQKLAGEAALLSVYRDIEMPLVEVLTKVESNGVLIDINELRRQSRDLSARMLAIQTRAFDVAGRHFNLDSPKQLQALLFDEFELPVVVKTPTGQPSTNEEALEAIANEGNELPRLILDYRSLAKLRSTYTDKLVEIVNPDTGRVHTSYHQGGAATGRLSSSDPNLQNIPIRSEDGRRIRRAFIAPPGRCILAFDYSQIELRIMAHLSGDAGLIAAFEQGLDIHRATAAEVFGVPLEKVEPNQRRAAKAINFGLIYGMGAFGLARQLDVTRAEAQDYIALYFNRYPGVHDFMERTRQEARDKGYVETVFGRRLYLTEIHSRNANQRAGAERAAINAPMQGTAADIIKRAMRRVHDWLQPHADKALMIMQVHDELVFEADTAFTDPLIEAVRERMQGAAELRVPLIVDAGAGSNWDEAH
ncbi:DNA polymerase I [Xanthomonadaceae bacterium JHOS43]|nr:DNA polymerase I [Xanthomonadaceae bacterium JHOS43]